jgi:multidrug transporter EmrE-like cation transporter
MKDIMSKIQNWMDNSIVDEILLLALLIAFVETCAQNTIKTSEHSTFQFILGLLIYMLVGYILHYAYSKFPMSKVNVIWSCMSIITATLIGYWLYNEPMNHWIIFSVLFAILAVYCVYKGSN